MRRLTAFPLAFVVAFALVSPVAAYVLWGWYNTGAIDTDRNRQADLTVCFGVNLGDLVYVNRGDVEQEIEQWHQASQGNFSSLGICNNDGSNVQMLYADFGTCEPGQSSVLGATNNPGNVGYNARTIWFNSQCLDDFDWYDADGIDPGKYSALATALHEVGHALGLHHSGDPNAVMYNVGPVHCASTGVDWRLAFDDADGYRDRYPGLNDTSTGFPADAVCDP